MYSSVKVFTTWCWIFSSCHLISASANPTNSNQRNSELRIQDQVQDGCSVIQKLHGEITECRLKPTGGGGGAKISCTSQVSPENTVAEIRCRQFWTPNPSTSQISRRTCINREWISDHYNFSCNLECGVANYYSEIKDKVVIQKSSTPWVAGIFSMDEEDQRQGFHLTCQGTLISTRAILTSAKCVTFSNTTVDRRPGDLKIALGNFKPLYSMNSGLLHSVEKVVVHHEYNTTDQNNDIALISLTKPVTVDVHRHPVCLPVKDDELRLDAEGKAAVLVGEVLTELEIKVVGGEACRKLTPGKMHLKSSKFCAESVLSFCKPFGMGIAFPHPEIDRKWVLHGIRTGITNSDCQTPVIFTKVAHFRQWEDKELNREPPIYTKSGIVPLSGVNLTSNMHPSIVPAILRTTAASTFQTPLRTTPTPNIFLAIYRTTTKASSIPARAHEREPLTPEPYLIPHYTTEKTFEIETFLKPTAQLKPVTGNYDRDTTRFPSELYPAAPTRFPISTPKSQKSHRHQSTTFAPPQPVVTTTKVTIEPSFTITSVESHCPPLKAVPGVAHLCKQDAYEDIDDCSNGGQLGTVATLTCNKYYKSAFGPSMLRKECMASRQWAPSRPFGCTLECGISSNPRRSFIANGILSDRVSWPWHATIFKKIGDSFQYICGATLISRSLLVTAAHCIAKPMMSDPVDMEDLRIVLAAKSSKYTENLFDPISQPNVFYVKKIAIPDSYNGVTFEADIAVIQLEFSVRLSDYVKPVCFPFHSKENSDIVQLHLSPETKGYTVGFGIDETGNLSSRMKETNLPVVSHRDCGEVLARFPSHSMFCAGYLNGSSAVCNGDSGSGLVFSDGTGFSNRFIIQGIVSYGDYVLGSRSCNSKSYAVFTKVSSFADWVQEQLDLLEPE